ncbi:hypothetical protein FXF51_46280 [Nonomuraea sp. PA05]|uniref:hypothetical protein n=1 Tax=Nonomuraea sp. PA05 TaxID=2604466 RepID=UPI0011D8EFD8|nr:hypothetical protein [Nonomuraea sp. PA05]TYB55078.1 hypothetical protein FXF51_46280 [Nonomuraea sp. PA05]
MAHSQRDVETEIIDLSNSLLSEIEAMGPLCLDRIVTRILAADADPAEPLFGGDPPGEPARSDESP